MYSRSTLVATAAALSVLGLSACKSVYSDTFAYRKNSFQPPPAKQIEIKAPPSAPMPLEGVAPGGVLPGEMPGGIPGVPGPAPGVPGAPDGAPPAPAVPGAPPAVPGLN